MKEVCVTFWLTDGDAEKSIFNVWLPYYPNYQKGDTISLQCHQYVERYADPDKELRLTMFDITDVHHSLQQDMYHNDPNEPNNDNSLPFKFHTLVSMDVYVEKSKK